MERNRKNGLVEFDDQLLPAAEFNYFTVTKKDGALVKTTMARKWFNVLI